MTPCRSTACRRQRYFLDLFGGKGGIAKAIQSFGFVSYVWEIENGIQYDLTNKSNLSRLKSRISSGEVLGAMLAPPCTNFSVARDRTMVVRSRMYPWGVPNLPPHEQNRVEVANVVMKACLTLLIALHKQGLPWILENPASSKMFFLPELVKLAADDNVTSVVVDFCQFGTDWKKPTMFLFGNFDPVDLESLASNRCRPHRGMCCRTGKKHVILTGNGPGGIPWTRVAQPYPPKISKKISSTPDRTGTYDPCPGNVYVYTSRQSSSSNKCRFLLIGMLGHLLVSLHLDNDLHDTAILDETKTGAIPLGMYVTLFCPFNTQ